MGLAVRLLSPSRRLHERVLPSSGEDGIQPIETALALEPSAIARRRARVAAAYPHLGRDAVRPSRASSNAQDREHAPQDPRARGSVLGLSAARPCEHDDRIRRHDRGEEALLSGPKVPELRRARVLRVPRLVVGRYEMLRRARGPLFPRHHEAFADFALSEARRDLRCWLGLHPAQRRLRPTARLPVRDVVEESTSAEKSLVGCGGHSARSRRVVSVATERPSKNSTSMASMGYSTPASRLNVMSFASLACGFIAFGAGSHGSPSL